MILVDASAWIEYDRGTGSLVDRRLASLIDNRDSIAVTEPVEMEILAGSRDDRSAMKLKRLLRGFNWIPTKPGDFEGAAKLYRACRRGGVTPRGILDCMVASIALRSGAEILTGDRDFTAMQSIVPLRLIDVN